MERKCMSRLESWALRNERGVMVLRGARQVGKTTLVRLLAKKLGLTLVEVNMEDTQTFSKMLRYREKAKDILELILLEKGVSEDPDKLLFFFDEAQAVKGFYGFLRYFKEKAPEYRVIAAGSLFEFEIEGSEAQGPTGRVEYAYLEPMTFEEFLLAANKVAYDKLQAINLKEAIAAPLHEIFSNLYREYLVCGGMPAAVKAKIAKESILRIDEIKTDIITGYLNDVNKYPEQRPRSNNNKAVLREIFEKVLANPATGMSYTKLADGVKAQETKLWLNTLLQAKVIRRSLHTSRNKVPLKGSGDSSSYKLYNLDVGLCYSYLEMPLSKIYTAEDINDLVNGAVAEQFVAQTIAALEPFHQTHELFHWERKAKNAIAEVDFKLQIQDLIVPIECKSGHSNKMYSLHQLIREQGYKLALRLYSGNIRLENLTIKQKDKKPKECTLVSLPHYLLERFVAKIDQFKSMPGTTSTKNVKF